MNYRLLRLHEGAWVQDDGRLRALERVVNAAREVRADLEHQCCEQGDDVECVCEPGLDPCPRCRMFALLDRALAALDETEVRDE